MRETDVGEVVVYEVRDKDIPIVHRIVRKFGSGLVVLPGTAVAVRNVPNKIGTRLKYIAETRPSS